MKALRRALRRRIRWGSPSLGGLVRAASVLSVAFMAILATPAVAYYQEPGLEGVSSRLAGRKVTIECLTPREERRDIYISLGVEAYVTWKTLKGRRIVGSVARFRGVHCDNLVALMAGDLSGRRFHDVAWSVLVIVHESGHLKGAKWSFDEAKTQCWAMQKLPAALDMLGVPDSFFRDMLIRQIKWIHHNELNGNYQLEGCQAAE